jgi:GAF domain-containing protein
MDQDRQQVADTGRVNRLYSVLSQVNEAMVRVREPQELYQEACRIAVEDGMFLLAWIGFVEPGSQYIRPLAKYGRDEGYLESVRLSVSDGVPEGRGPTGTALREGRPFVNNDTENNPIMSPWRDEQMKRGYRSSASFPLKVASQTIGVITLYAGEPDYFDDEEVRLLLRLADDFSFALESAQVAHQRDLAMETLRESRDELEETANLLLGAARMLAEPLEVRAVLQGLVEVLAEATGRHRVIALLHDPECDEFIAQAGQGPGAPTPGTRIPVSTLAPQVREAIAEMRVCVADFDSAERSAAGPGRGGAAAARLVLAVPIVVKDRVVAYVGVDEPGVRREFTRREIDLIEGITSQAATAIANAFLHESTQEAARLSDTLNSVNATVHSTLEIDRVMQRALVAGLKALRCDSGTIEMLEGDEWAISYQHGLSEEVIGRRLSKEEAPSSTLAALNRAPVAIADLSRAEEGTADIVRQFGLKSVLAVPLIARDVVTGCILFCSTREIRRFTPAEIDFGRKLGSVVSLSIENARLYQAEHVIAQTLQQALLSLPEYLAGVEFAPFYQSATESTLAGGDFYDIFEANDQCIGITIGDIAGKGLDAAILTSLVRNTIRAHASEKDKTPSQILTLANAIVLKATAREAFATVFFGILDRQSGCLVYTSAGHATAAILKADGTLLKLPATDTILGAFAGIEFDQAEACLEHDDVLFLYTDGLTEARCDGELYGEGRLFAALTSAARLSPRDLAARMVADVTSFACGGLRDDLAILAVRRRQE